MVKTKVFEHHVSKRLCFTMKNWPTFQKHWNVQGQINIFSKTLCFTMNNWCFSGCQKHCKTRHFWNAWFKNPLFYNEFGRFGKSDMKMVLNSPNLIDLQKSYKNICLLMIFCSKKQFLLTVSQKTMQNVWVLAPRLESHSNQGSWD